MRAFTILLAALTLVLVAACNAASKPEQARVIALEWSITPSSNNLKPGHTDFVLSNEGAHSHELVVVKTDLPPSKLPKTNDKLDEEKLHVVGRVPIVSAGASGHASMVLSPGKYLLLCNLVDQGATPVSHLEQGMMATITVAP